MQNRFSCNINLVRGNWRWEGREWSWEAQICGWSIRPEAQWVVITVNLIPEQGQGSTANPLSPQGRV